jgi:hypothetical protein
VPIAAELKGSKSLYTTGPKHFTVLKQLSIGLSIMEKMTKGGPAPFDSTSRVPIAELLLGVIEGGPGNAFEQGIIVASTASIKTTTGYPPSW